MVVSGQRPRYTKLNKLESARVQARAASRVDAAAVRTGRFAAEIAMRIQERCPAALRASARRLATADIRISALPVLQAAVLPNAVTIAREVRALVALHNASFEF